MPVSGWHSDASLYSAGRQASGRGGPRGGVAAGVGVAVGRGLATDSPARTATSVHTFNISL